MTQEEKELMTNVEAAWLMEKLNEYAEDMFGEFGFDTCHSGEQYVILKRMLYKGVIKLNKDA